jgi:Ca-activated chloride channel family protein
MKRILTIQCFLLAAIAQAQSPKTEKFIQAGNEFYKQEQFNKAAVEYNKAVQADPADLVARFNQANAIYKQDQKVEAVKLYNSVSKDAVAKDMRSKAWYNKGVILSQEKNIEESIEAYKNALRNSPDDKEARENLQKALLELKKKPPPPEKKENKNNKKQQQQQKQSQSKMSPKDALQKLQLLEQKEKEVQQRMQKEKNTGAGSQPKDW